MPHVCRPCCYLWAVGARLGLSLPAPRREEEGSRVFSAEQREEEGGFRLYRTEFPLLPVCYLLCLVSQ